MSSAYNKTMAVLFDWEITPLGSSVEHLPSKCEALSSTSSTTKNKITPLKASGRLPLEDCKMMDVNFFLHLKTSLGAQTSTVYDFRRPKYLSGILGQRQQVKVK
jgi:hypothetical protein